MSWHTITRFAMSGIMALVGFRWSVPNAWAAVHFIEQPAARQSTVSAYSIRIDSRHPALTLFRNGRPIRAYPVALGTPETPTPVGHWRIVDKQIDWGKGFGTRWMGLDVPWGTYGIHGTNVPSSIGMFASHGCIRMRNADVEALYRIVPLGTSVDILGDPLRRLRPLKDGDIGADVLTVQHRLRSLGYQRVVCNGRFTPNTQLSLVFFQLSKRIPMDGVVDSDDYRALGLSKGKTDQTGSSPR